MSLANYDFALSGVAMDAKPVVPSDTVDLPDAGRVAGLRIGTAGGGSLSIRTLGGGDTVRTLTGVTSGEYIPIAVTRVMSTNTDVQNIVALVV